MTDIKLSQDYLGGLAPTSHKNKGSDKELLNADFIDIEFERNKPIKELLSNLNQIPCKGTV